MAYHLVQRKMQVNNILLTVTDKELLKKVQDCTFLFPLEGFCVGYEQCFKISEIKISNAYILINRILDDKDLNVLENILKSIPNNISGIIFEDLGVLELINELNLNVKKIYYMIHNGLNYQSINEYLKMVDSVIISSDITKEEINEILDKTNKPCIIYTFGLNDLMYSRRTLLSNFDRYHNLEIKRVSDITEPINNYKFKVMENDFGTIFYSGKYYYNKDLMLHKNILYNWVNPLFLDTDIVVELVSRIINNQDLDNLNIELDNTFLNKKSIVNIKEVIK
ncbi:MAG: U32 family peptidase [Bacilli bacterium]|nr:U32 family peptidase [Bacilli bacterium]